MLGFPLKAAQPVDFAPFTAYLKTKYGKEEAKSYQSDVDALALLRQQAVTATTCNETGCEPIFKYLAQIDAVQLKLPVSETAAKVRFCWAHAFRPKQKTTIVSWAYERAACLYNLGAMETMAGARQNRASQEGINAAQKHFMLGATIFTYLRDTVVGSIGGQLPEELTPLFLTLAVNLCNAHAQACYFEMAKLKGLQPGLCAKLANQAAELFSISAAGSRNPDLANVIGLEWGMYTEYQRCLFVAQAQQLQSRVDLAAAENAGTGYGVEVARLMIAAQNVDAAVAEGRKKGFPVPLDAALALQKAIGSRLATARSELNSIYVEGVPPVSSLPHLDKVGLTKAQPMPEWTLSGPALFATLLPSDVAAAVAEFETELSASVQAKQEAVQGKGDEARKQLASVGLPAAVEASESSVGLPEAMWTKISAVQSAGGIGYLRGLVKRNAELSAANTEQLAKIESSLAAEAAEDDRLRRQYGSRYNCTPSGVLTKSMKEQMQRYKSLLERARGSDNVVRDKLEATSAALENLGRSRTTLDGQVPSAGRSGAGEPERVVLAASLKSLGELISAREALLSAYLAATRRVSVAERLMKAGADAKAAIFTTTKADLASCKEATALDANLAEQEALMKQIMSQFAAFSNARQEDPTMTRREEALQRLQAAVDMFEEVKSDCKQGEQFYTDLAAHVESLGHEASSHITAREIERGDELLRLRGESEAELLSTSDAEFARRLAGGPAAGGPAPSAPASGPPAAAYAPPPAVASRAAAAPAPAYAPPATYAPPPAAAPSGYAQAPPSYGGPPPPAYGAAPPSVYGGPSPYGPPAGPNTGYVAPPHGMSPYTATPIGGPYGARPRG